MKAQRNSGWRMLSVLAVTALVGFAQTQTGGPVQPASPGYAQQQKTAYPGAINYVEGSATLNGQPLTPNVVGSTVIGPNQTLATTNGYVEVLLTPGAFLRIGHASEARLVSAGLAGVDVQLTRGSALVEVADLVKGSKLTVGVNGTPVDIDKNGLYAFDASANVVRVLDGKADVEAASRAIILKKGDEVAVGPQLSKKRDFNVKSAENDPLYVWSKVRSQDESQVNLHTANLMVSGGAWYGPGWYWDPFWSSYAFMPAAGLLYSPFGWGFYSPVYYRTLWAGGYWPRYGVRPAYVRPYRGFAPAHVSGMGAMHAGGFRGGRR